MQDFEKLGVFYLGKRYDLGAGEARDELVLYDSKDLTTHAVCLGMTGSGKTGLCLALLEEAALDAVPAIAIDPKGDLGNLLLTFPDLAPDDFQPWIDPRAAARQGLSVGQSAAKTAQQWREGLNAWGQDADRIRRFREAVELSIYTPGSSAGLPLTVLRSFAAPEQAVLADDDAFRARVSAAACGLLALLGIDADPVRSREHILISNILSHAWRAGRDLDLAALIREIQSPPIDKIGVMDLETFIPTDQRVELSMQLNNLLASPSFAGWMEGEPLDVKRLLYTPQGKPRLSILSIAHLSEAERMFFVTILLNEVLAWIRTQSGTSSLRALLYMDEVFGYFPPTANPPSKTPMLTLLKQARAYGLGVILATQNPVDLDYKGLANTGTWFLGRLQTERDKARVLEGLEGASAQAGATFDRQQMEATLAGLSSRVFLMNNVHEDHPAVFQTRWALSFLRGPITRSQIQVLMADQKAQRDAELAAAKAAGQPQRERLPSEAQRPESDIVVPPGIDVHYLPCGTEAAVGATIVYRPALLGRARLHFARAAYQLDTWQDRAVLQRVDRGIPDPTWEDAPEINAADLQTDGQPRDGADFSPLPAALGNPKKFKSWATQLRDHFYQTATLTVWKCTELKTYSEPGESESDFRIRLAGLAHEARDLAVEKLRTQFATKAATLKGRIETAEAAVQREQSQASRATMDSVVSFGSTVLGALFGRKIASSTNVSRGATSMRSLGRAAQQRSDVARAREKVESLNEDLAELDSRLGEAIGALEEKYAAQSLQLESFAVRPRKSDTEVAPLAVVWTPWQVDDSGLAEPRYDL